MSTPAAKSYRQLLNHCAYAEMMIPDLPVPGGLLQSVRTRYREVVSKNLDLPLHQRRNLARKQQEALDKLCAALVSCHENETMVSIARALSTGFGNEAYRSTLFRHFTETPAFDAECAERNEVGAAAVADRQNRLMQAAVLPYLDRLCILCSPTLQHSCTSGSSSSDSSSDNALLRALSSPKAGVAVQVFPCDPYFVAVEIDESLNKQTIYLAAPPSSSAEMTEAAADDEARAPLQDNNKKGSSAAAAAAASPPRAGGAGGSVYHHRVDSAQLETQRGTILHLEWMNSGRLLLDALLDESLIHRSRGTVIVGHGIAGAVGTALGLLMISEQFLIRNVITFGAPKVVEEIEDNTAAELNSLRVVMAGDPLVPLPVSGAEGRLFRHVGELLQVHSDSAERAFSSREGRSFIFQQRRKQNGAVADDDVDVGDNAAEHLFDAMSADDGPEGKSTSKQNHRAKEGAVDDNHVDGDDDVDDDEDAPPIDFSESEAVAAEEKALQWPYSVLAYRAALVDRESELEYFEEDAGVWEADDIRESMHGHDAFQKSEADVEN